jgi:hypothetical protein
MARRLSRIGSGGPVRDARFVALVLGVSIVHGCVTRSIAERMEDFAIAARMPARIEVAYVRTLEPEAPPVAAPQPPPPPPVSKRRASRPRPAKAASAPESVVAAASAPESAVAEASAPGAAVAATSAPPATVAAAPLPTPERPADVAVDEAASASAPAVAGTAAAEPAALVEAAAASAAPSGPVSPPASAAVRTAEAASVVPAQASASAALGEPFDWPASTRVSFVLTGNYRGEVNGYAQVEWVRLGTRYQVNLDLLVGPAFAPIIARRMTSEGDLTADGLTPSRYDEDTQVAFRERRRVSVLFEPEAVVLSNGQRRERWRGVQDTASQFVQLTYLFTMRPELLKVGNAVEVPLALPRSMDRWTYDVLDESVIQTPFGPLPAFHLKPRRATPRPGELSAEIWFAPQLRYLPVRIRIEQDPQTWLDLVIARKPELASR